VKITVGFTGRIEKTTKRMAETMWRIRGMLQVVVGHMGRVLFSRAILHMYVLSFTVTGLSMIAIGIICVPYYYRVRLGLPIGLRPETLWHTATIDHVG
jgi:hypothetical protein